MKKDFNWRLFTSFALFLSFWMLMVSGAILYLFPIVGSAGVGSGFVGLTRRAWLNQHLVFGTLFALLSGYHLFVVNREAFFSYLKRTIAKGSRRPVELLSTLVLTALVAAGTLKVMPSFSSTRDAQQGSPLHSEIQERDQASDDDEALLDHHRHHQDDRDRYESGSESPRLAYDRDYADARGDVVGNSGGNYAEAPDDELHRRTTASCRSCH